MNNQQKSYRIAGKKFSRPELLAVAYEKLSVLGTPQWEREIWSFLTQWFSSDDTIDVITSGSTGMPKEIQIKKEHMKASARATVAFLGLSPGNTSLLCLPVRYIAGKMMIVRALESGLDLHFVEPSSMPDLEKFDRIDFSAMVPIQVKSLIEAHGMGYLEKIRNLIIGGGFLLPGMEDQIRQMTTAVWQTYGMTETITHIALRRLNGEQASEYYSPLPGVKLGVDQYSCLQIECSYLGINHLQTKDLVEINEEGDFKIRGRVDNVINSGGVKLFPEQLEKKLEGFLESEYFLGGMPDDRLGERLVLLIESEKEFDKQVFYLWKEIERRLSGYRIPKEIIFLKEFVRTGNGKINRKSSLKKARL
jgi:O-succinylbenzoic acid--CoA ligase